MIGEANMGIKNEFEYTIMDISKELGISKEKCRQVLLMAMKKLKNPKYENQFNEIEDILELLEKDKV
jgi:DNA-directed RNA polymerase sigma subunit (sigma70/sigma32)